MFSQKTKNLINNLLIGALIFVVPSNLFWVVSESSSYIHGLRLDYLLPKFYISDILILLFSAWLIFTKQLHWPSKKTLITKARQNWGLVLLSAVFVLYQFFTDQPLAAIGHAYHLLQGFWLIWLLSKVWTKIKPITIFLSINFSLIFQAGLALLQFSNQKSIAGYLLLGEPNLNQHIGLAKQMLLGQNLILPYGTTAHPNVLGGFLAIFLVLNWLISRKMSLKAGEGGIAVFSSFLAVSALWFTQSWSAILALILTLFLLWKKPRLSSLIHINLIGWTVAILIVTALGKNPTQPSLFRRAYLNQSAWQMLKAYPATGVGINNFVAKVESFSPTREVVRFTQPAHHTPLLILSEIGILGLVVIISWIRKIKNWHYALALASACVLPILVLDHYLYTLQTGILLFCLLLVNFKNFSIPPRR